MASNLLSDDKKKRIIEKLNKLIVYATTNSPYYKEKYNDYVEIQAFDDILCLPFTERDELQEYYPCGHLCVKIEDVDAYFETSGSTGNPLSVIPDMSYEKVAQFGEFLDFWMKLKNDRVYLAIVALPYEMNPMGLKYHISLISQNVTVIPTSVRTTLCPPKKMIRLINDLKPQLIVGRPLEIMRYAEGMKAMNIDSEMSSIRKIFVTGETMSDAKWKRIDDLYGGVDIYSTYGLTELDTGLVSCEQHRYHLPNSTNILVEVLDDSGNMVDEGEKGHVVITNLEQNYSPLIRYRTGDVACYQSRCTCGMNTPYLKLFGRELDKKLITGKEVFPVEIEEIIFSMDEVGCEYQLVYNEGLLKINVERAIDDNSTKESLEKKITERVYDKLGINCEVFVFEFNELADKFGISRAKGCRFIDVTGMNEDERMKALRINVCSGNELD